MNITFQNQNQRTEAPTAGYAERADRERTVRAQEKQRNGAPESAGAVFYAGEIGISSIGNDAADAKAKDKGKNLTDLQQEAEYTDAGIQQNYMTVVSHTMSEEDFKALSEEGFHFASLDPEEAVTIVDRIKAELVRSGQQIAGYTDDMDMDTLAAAVGSDVLARALADSFCAADIPLTEENVADVNRAWNMTLQLNAPTDGTRQYLIDNELEPEIRNFYLAQNSGAGNGKSMDADFLADPGMKQQIDQMIAQSGMEPDDETREAANWLLERNLPLTAENLERLQELQQVTFPLEEKVFAEAAAEAVACGKSSVHANLVVTEPKKETVYEKAVSVLEYYKDQYEERGQSEDLSARRQLEEIRLRMTAEVNVKLLKSGFAIDTAPMEELITALRDMEKEVAESYFSEDAAAVAKYENWNRVTQVMEELPAMPVQMIGMVQPYEPEDPMTLSRFHEEGRVLQEDYRRAGERYEALMTVPRADLGDSIRKAFSNVDDILQELNLDRTEENRRAVRILGYNHMDIDQVNVERVLEADASVRQVIERMTPAATLRMIRDGINPLEQNFAQLNRYFDELPEEYGEASESYSRYLYGLEQNKQITREERESYIGIYRLLRQIEKSDGAAVGAVVNVQANLQFSNLLSAVRSGKFRHMDVKASDELGVLKELVKKGESFSIDEQISAAYEKQRLEETRNAVHTESAVVSMLQRGEVPLSAENLLAAQEMLRMESNPFRALRQKAQKLRMAQENSVRGEDEVEKCSDLWEQLDDKSTFQEEFGKTISELQSMTEGLTFEDAQESIDVRSLQMIHRQLGILGSLARSEEYLLPMYVGEELATVHLTIERGGAEKGGVSIAVDYAEDAHVEAHFQVKDGRLEGFLLGNTKEEVTKLQDAADIFYDLVQENNFLELKTVDLPVVSKGNVNVTRMSDNNSREEGTSPDNGMLYRLAKLFLQAIG